MSTIRFSEAQLNAMIDHARKEAPKEACGLLLGRGNRVESVLPVVNIAPEPTSRYQIDDATVAQHHHQIIGFYHSHPQHDPIPSQTDIQEAWSNGAVYVIIGLKSIRPKVAAWIFHHEGSGTVGAVDVITHGGIEAADHDTPLTKTQQRAVIASALLALIFLIIVSLELLPPAPPIP